MSKLKISELPIEIQVAMINAARDVSVAKITQKKSSFDGYVQPYYWFEKALDEVFVAYQKLDAEPKQW